MRRGTTPPAPPAHRPTRPPPTTPPSCDQLARRVRLAEEGGATLEVSCGKLLAFVGQIVQAVTAAAPNLALRLYVQCAQVADSCGDDDGAYEYLTQAFTLFEEEVAEQSAKLAALSLLSAALPHMTSFSPEQYETLARSATQYGATLLKKPDQEQRRRKAQTRRSRERRLFTADAASRRAPSRRRPLPFGRSRGSRPTATRSARSSACR